jgi:hypothetical protein
MNYVFDLCVALLYWVAHLTGTTYKQINVILFVLVHPALTLFFWVQWRRAANKLKQQAIALNKHMLPNAVQGGQSSLLLEHEK